MEIPEHELAPALRAAIDATRAAVAPLSLDAPRLELAGVAAQLTAGITDDAPLAGAAFLHEALGPRAELPAEIARDVGEGVATLWRELRRLGEFQSGVQWGAGAGLARNQSETLRKMLLAVVGDPRLVVARLAIQLARLRGAKALPEAERQRLAGETRAVFAPLANRLGIWQLKWELEDLAFRWLEPAEYKRIAAELKERRTDRERYISEFCAALTRELASAGLDTQVFGRPKHIYSIHRKMQRKQLAFEQVFDVRAVRILCRSVPDCYAALGVVHGHWTYMPGEFDDYIATPKDNFYRSIHTAVIGPEDKPVEVQIRTDEMHAHAELGVAAHWRYKEGGRSNQDYERKIEWVRRLLAPAGERDADPDFLEGVRAELFEDRVYALTPRGEVVDLPQGATPLDFAYHVHTSLGHRCRGAKVNGRIVPLTCPLQNGEVVEIITAKQEAPSRDWMATDAGYLASPRSRSKVRAWFRERDASENEAAGRELLEREMQRLGAGSELVAALVNDLKAQNAPQLWRLIGEGEIGTAQLAQAIAARLAPPAAAAAPRRPRAPPRAKAPGKSGGKSRGGPIEIAGVGDLPVTMARCCTPLRPAPIVGYVTLGRGVTIHAAGCPHLLRMSTARPERVLSASWRASEGPTQSVEIVVQAWDRPGLVRDITQLVADENIGIEALNTSTDPRAGTARTVMRIGVNDLTQLARVLRAIGTVKSVTSARRTG